jgi:hypothetical protein
MKSESEITNSPNRRITLKHASHAVQYQASYTPPAVVREAPSSVAAYFRKRTSSGEGASKEAPLRANLGLMREVWMSAWNRYLYGWQVSRRWDHACTVYGFTSATAHVVTRPRHHGCHGFRPPSELSRWLNLEVHPRAAKRCFGALLVPHALDVRCGFAHPVDHLLHVRTLSAYARVCAISVCLTWASARDES